MLNTRQLDTVVARLPFLDSAESPLLRELTDNAAWLRLPAGRTVFNAGDVCTALAVLVSGSVRVFTIGETGREITLYRFAAGESCILTVNCILSHDGFPAIAVVEEAAEAVIVPQDVFRRWINQYQPWRDYVFSLLSARLATVMAVVEEVAFRRMDARIADHLLTHCPPDAATLATTHQQIAAELGTSREVVSRILEDFAAGGLVRTGRGAVTLRDRAGLRRRATG